jgi:hypothetical protein
VKVFKIEDQNVVDGSKDGSLVATLVSNDIHTTKSIQSIAVSSLGYLELLNINCNYYTIAI